jgi:hypothetical protein
MYSSLENNNTSAQQEYSQDKMLMKGLVVTDKSERVYHFHHNTLHAANELLQHQENLQDVDSSILMRGDEFTKQLICISQII